jgi:cysteine synthase
LPDTGTGPTLAEGIGTARITGQFAKAKVDGAFRISDREAVEMAYYLKEFEGLYVGPAAALNVVGAVKVAKRLGPGHTIVCVVCDGGSRYRSTLFNSEELSKLGLTPTMYKKGKGNLDFVDQLDTLNYYEKH